MTVFNVSSVAMLWLCCTAAWAQNQACEVRVSPPAFDFGLTDRGALLQQSAGANELSFGSRRVQVQVVCDQASPLTLRFDAPGADAERYRFGIGTLRLKVMAMRVDGVVTQRAGEYDVLRPGERLLPLLASGRRLDIEFEVEGQISNEASRVADLTRLDGEGVFRLD
ncbi:hypothetical protein PS925_02575 [Pseudomonas fluorescens]|uniref:DUF1120 domain-containing protein n=1 Tax=Pseudomonas fluorescens TaxID=294 RepID=A0A5E7TXU7_PSEFL|nr:hypothetical protein [Pseudomonas fluorescens]VVQ03827.1 hypothetical protein PS925_02575 [Pseudomonas fluorescens]